MKERWYPLTYPGYYTDTMDIIPSVSSECCVLDVSAYRSRIIEIHARTSGGYCILTDEAGAVLCRWNDAPVELVVPETAKRLYLSNEHTENPDFYLMVPSGAVKKPCGLLFYEDFTNASSLDGNDFVGLLPTDACSENGLMLPMGIEHAVVINKSTAVDNWTLTAEVTLTDYTEEIFLGTRITQSKPCKHASLCSVDFASRTLRLYRGSNGQTIPTDVIKSTDISELIPADGRYDYREFTLHMERVNVAVRALVTNNATGKSVSVLQELIPEETAATIAGGCAAGKMYDSPQLFVTAGKPTLRRFYAAAKTTPKVMFFGDSLTQGAHNLPENAWAQMSAEYFGNSICCGRGSGDIWSCLNQVRSLVPLCRPKAMVITIGINNAVDVTASLYEKFIHMAEYWGVIPIINCVPACDKRPQGEKMNRILRKLPTLKCRFDLVTSHYNTADGGQITEYYAADETHLNGEGNRVLYERFIHDFSWLQTL